LAAAVGLEKWEKETLFGGEFTIYNKVLKMVKEITGRRLLVVRSAEELMKEVEKIRGYIW
jgi:hypothetical protein